MKLNPRFLFIAMVVASLALLMWTRQSQQTRRDTWDTYKECHDHCIHICKGKKCKSKCYDHCHGENLGHDWIKHRGGNGDISPGTPNGEAGAFAQGQAVRCSVLNPHFSAVQNHCEDSLGNKYHMTGSDAGKLYAGASLGALARNTADQKPKTDALAKNFADNFPNAGVTFG